MTKDKNTICDNCIYKNYNSNICNKHKFILKKHFCKDYRSIFTCNQKSCNECGKCGGYK